jgi:hypothetical protein
VISSFNDGGKKGQVSFTLILIFAEGLVGSMTPWNAIQFLTSRKELRHIPGLGEEQSG